MQTQNATPDPKTKNQSEERSRQIDILDRTRAYALQSIKFYRAIPKEPALKILGEQYLRAATSIGANLAEAKAGQSKADFISKVSIACKETHESLYWLRLFKDDGSFHHSPLNGLITETEELIRILSTIILHSKES